MKKISIWRVLFTKPIETFVASLFYYAAIVTIFGDMFQGGLEQGESQMIVIGISAVLGLMTARWYYSHKAMKEMQQTAAMQGGMKNRRSGSLLFNMVDGGVKVSRGINGVFDRQAKSLENAICSSLSFTGGNGSSGYDRAAAERQAANQRAIDRWNAQGNAKWHEWHAMDMAKKGRTGGAYYHSNQAQYYRNQAKNI